MASHPQNGALVCVWRNAESFTRMASGRYGHVSLKLVGPAFEGTPETSRYVSWWPDLGVEREALATRRLGPFSSVRAPRLADCTYRSDRIHELGERSEDRLRAGFVPLPHQRVLNLGADPAAATRAEPRPDGLVPQPYWVWGKTPDAKVFLPAASASGAADGLDLRAIARWWALLCAAPSAWWSTTERNCSEVVITALLAGGAGRIAHEPRLPFTYPTVVETWARKLEGRIAGLRVAAGVGAGAVGAVDAAPEAEGRVFTVAEWRAELARASKRPTGSLVARLEALLGRHDAAAARDDAGERETILKGILDVVHDDLFANPVGQGKHGVVARLGRQCADVLAGRAAAA